MTKTYDQIQAGDIFRTEYGAPDNIVEIVFESNEIEFYEIEFCEQKTFKWLKTKGHYKNGDEFIGYDPIYKNKVPSYEVIGRENQKGCIYENMATTTQTKTKTKYSK